MSTESPSHLGPWLGLLLLSLASAVFAYVQLDDLPDLGILFAPDLTVRSVALDTGEPSELQKFKRGSRLVALEGQSVENLRDLRAVLENLPEPEAGRLEDEEVAEGLVSYQVVRPLYPFNVLLKGDGLAPTELPAGVEPTDRLVSINNQRLPTQVGPEAVRSIVASRPEALLGFERRDAVFQGEIEIPEPERPIGTLVCFGLASLMMAGVWRWRDQSLPPASALATAFETLSVAWIVFLTFEYQWIMADYALATVVIVALAWARPFAMLARSLWDEAGARVGWWALALGTLGAALVLYMLHGGMLDDAEHALRIAAMVPAGFILYELFVSIEGDHRDTTMGEGAGYLSLIVALSLFAAGLAYFLEPVAFLEDRWRWFASIVLGLMWFGDIIFCIRGLPRGSYDEIATPVARAERVGQFLKEAEDLVPDARMAVVMIQGDAKVMVSMRDGGLSHEGLDQPLGDALEILVQEGARIPLPLNVDRVTHPVAGIADALGIVLALRLQPPMGGVLIDGVDLILLGLSCAPSTQTPESDALERPGFDVVDAIRAGIGAEIWTAALIEGLVALDQKPLARPQASLERLEQQLAEAESRRRALEERLASVEVEHGQRASQHQPIDVDGAFYQLSGPPHHYESLLETQLVEAVDFLLEDALPIVLAGGQGAGKCFVARVASARDGRRPLWGYRVDAHPPSVHQGHLFGEPGEELGGLVGQLAGASLVVEGAQSLGDMLLLRLCAAAEEHAFRLYLAFDEEYAVDQSPLVSREPEVVELLEHRELVVPDMSARSAVLEPILMDFLADSANRRRRDVVDFSGAAMEALHAFEFEGHLDQARVEVDLAVARSRDHLVRFDDLSAAIRRHGEG